MPNHTLAALKGSLISAAHFPHGLCLTPLYLLLIGSAISGALYTYLLLGVGDGVGGIAVVVVLVLKPSADIGQEKKSVFN